MSDVNIRNIDPVVRKALLRIVSRLINQHSGTAIRGLHTDLLEKRRALTELQGSGHLTVWSNTYLPTFKLIAEIDPELCRLGFTQVNIVLTALRNLYIRDQDQSQFSFDVILGEVQRLAPGLDKNDVIPGLFLAQDFGYFSGWTSNGTAIGFSSVTLTDKILDFTSAEESWNQRMNAEKQFLGDNVSPPDHQSDEQQSVLSADFAFVGDEVLRSIIQRDYVELQSGSLGPKSRIVIAGGLIEALLLDRLLSVENAARAAKSAERDRRTKAVKPIDEWHLPALIDVAKELGIISDDAKKHSATIREYRNLVHPGLERRSSIAVREHVANIADQVLEMVIIDIRHAGKVQGASP